MPTYSFGSYTFPVYAYEDFSYTINNPPGVTGSVQKPITRSGGLSTNLFADTSSNFTFAGNASTLTVSSIPEAFSYVLLDDSGNSYTSSNSVPVNPGRFVDTSGNGVSGNAYTFYVNEPIPKIQLVAPFSLSTVISVPTLPPGLQFYVSGSNVDISGAPLTTIPTSNYLIIGRDASTNSKIITTNNTFTASNARILFDISGSPIVNMTPGAAIEPRVITTRFPPYPTGGTIKYTWNTLPDGIKVFDVYGNDKTASNSFGFSASDASHAFIISGTPSIASAYAYANAGIASGTYGIYGTRTSPLPALCNSTALTFGFGETVLFDQSAIPTLYSGVPVDSSANFFRAQTYFSSNVAISDIFSPDLRSDLSLTFQPSTGRAYLTGTPNLGTGTANYTIVAVNSNAVSRSYSAPISVQDDVITFISPTPTVDTCYNFILSRPLDSAKTGYYPSPIQFKAQAASKLPVTLSAPALVGTGIAIDSNGFLFGTPTNVTPLSKLSVTASAIGSPATATRDISFSVLNDVFTFGDVASSNLTYIQNVAITPFRIPVTTLSERPVIDFTSYQLPTGLAVSPAGVISGTPLTDVSSGTFTVYPTTGYVTGSNSYDYTLSRDGIMFFLDSNPVYVYPGSNATFTLTGISLSGKNVNNYGATGLSNLSLTVQPNTGVVSGTVPSGVPPSAYLPDSFQFQFSGNAANATDAINAAYTSYSRYLAYYGAYSKGATLVDRSYGYGTIDYISPTLYASNVQSFIVTDIQSDRTSSSLSPYRLKFDNYNAILTPYAVPGAGGTFFTGRQMWIESSAGTAQAKDFPFVSVTNIADSPFFGWVSLTYDDNAQMATLCRSQPIYPPVFWDSITSFPFKLRSNGAGDPSNAALASPYFIGGATCSAVAANSDTYVYFGGGDPIRRYSVTSNTVTSFANNFDKEVAYINSDVSTNIVATGSSCRKSYDFGVTPTAASVFGSNTTIKIIPSTPGDTICVNTTGSFNMNAYDIIYGNSTYLASGISVYGTDGSPYWNLELRYSTDNGSNWTNIPVFSGLFGNITDSNSVLLYPPIALHGLVFDGKLWHVFADVPDTPSPGIYQRRHYYHDLTSPLASDWNYTDVTSILNSGVARSAQASCRFVRVTPPILTVGVDGKAGAISIGNVAGDVPTFTAPTQTSYLFYTYIPIDPIQFAATGGSVFVRSSDLPDGLTFDPLTATITGTPTQQGTHSFTVYAKNTAGNVSTLTITTTTNIPRIVRKQDGAGAYTSLLRQYTEVLGAQNARDNRVFPNQEKKLGEFMAPEAPDVVTAVIDPKCRNPNC